MLPQPLDLGATAYLSPDKARQEYSEEEAEEADGEEEEDRRAKNKTGKNKAEGGNNESLIKVRRREQRCR